MSAAATSVTIVTQTCVKPERNDDFGRWQAATSQFVAGMPGFIEQKVLPPSPPAQVDWVILQRFENLPAARQWLNSPARAKRLEGVAEMVVGRDDVHIVADGGDGALPAPVSAVISTRVRPGMETAYRDWERRIAAAQAKAPGFQGYRFEPPVPGVQDDFLAILRFDSEANLQAWLDSPERKQLLAEGEEFTEEFHTRIAHTAFDHWFAGERPAGAAAPSALKQNMLVLLMLYPVVYLFGVLVQNPLLQGRLGLAFPIALFIGNVVSVVLLNWLVPWISRLFGWWLQPAPIRTAVKGYVLLLVLYTACILVFWRLS